MQERCAITGFIRGMLAVIGASLLALVLPSLASAGWSAPVDISGPGTSVSQTRIAGAQDGSSWVVWKRGVAGFDVIQGTRVTADGTPGPVVNISSPIQDGTDPVIASRADGSGIVAWLNQTALDDTVLSRSIAADGTLGPILTRSAVGPAGQPASEISIALGDDGSAALAWLKYNGSAEVVQGVRVAADGTSGAIHDLSDPASSARTPAISAAPVAVGQPPAYRAAWPQGTGATANVYTQAISPEDTLDGVSQLLWPRIPEGDPLPPAGPGTGGGPHDVNIGVEADGTLTIAWVRTRTDYFVVDDTVDPVVEIPYDNEAVESVRAPVGTAFSNDVGQLITPLTPIIPPTDSTPAVPYNVDDLYMTVPFGAQATFTWVHDLNEGGKRVETSRFFKGLYKGWVNATGTLAAVEDPVIAGNASSVAATGWIVPGLLPGQDTMGYRRFSDQVIDQPSSPAGGGIVYSTDPGFVVADDGVSLAAFTAIDGASVGSARIMVYTDPGIRVDPGTLNYGAGNIGVARTQRITIRSSGQTPIEVTGVSLSGANADRYELGNASSCVREIVPGAVCSLSVKFTPGTTGSQTAKVSVTSDLGVNEVNLTGRGLNRTRNGISLNKRNFAARKGRVIRIRATARNNGGVASNNTRVCVNLRKRALKLAGNRCRKLGAIPAGGSRTLNYRIRVTWRAPRGTKLPVTFVMRANNAVVRQVVAQVRRRGR